MEKSNIYNIIISLIDGIKNNNYIEENLGDNDIKLWNCKYLLNQVIRNLNLPEDHYFISKKADELWNKISNDDIMKYTYNNIVKVDKDVNESVPLFKGNKKEPYKNTALKKGENIQYNDKFTDEHIVPVSVIINELINLNELSYSNVKKVLDKIYICKVLKEEDQVIKPKYKRSSNYVEVIKTNYKNNKVEVKDFDYGTKI